MAIVADVVDTGEGKLYGLVLNENEIHLMLLLLEDCCERTADTYVPNFYEAIQECIGTSKFKRAAFDPEELDLITFEIQ